MSKGWTEKETEYLIENYKKVSIEHLQRTVKHTKDAIRRKASSLKITSRARRLKKGAPKPEKKVRANQRVFKTKEVTYAGKKSIRIDKKTVVFVPEHYTEKDIEWTLKLYNRK